MANPEKSLIEFGQEFESPFRTIFFSWPDQVRHLEIQPWPLFSKHAPRPS
jgi:hypothetical protein